MKIAVVIPTHKEQLNPLEEISLDRCRKVLGRYPLIFAVPEGKNFSWIPDDCRTIHFPHLGQGIQHYDMLMTSLSFYEAFGDFDYILIYHLDAFVFYDALEIFCRLGYDYIGAPWPRLYTRRVNGKLTGRVGNGGFCLKNVKAHHKLLIEHADLIESVGKKFPDDIFFAYCGKRDDCNFHVAPIDIAYKFAAEFNPARVVKKNDGLLPFGCHAWHRFQSEFYIELFTHFGYDLRPNQNLLKFSDGGLKIWLIISAIQRLIRRAERGQSCIHYLPTKKFASLCVYKNLDALKILVNLFSDETFANQKIFIFTENDWQNLLDNMKPEPLPHLLLILDNDVWLIDSLERRGLVYGRHVISFFREYMNCCEKIFHELGK